ncbi:hypothetical protein DPMN_099017 [Dreissena polymorpha]|uniref:Exonuclease domain-containing protein n=1 Tax=Dreissena polymorpha TaxID=45954 RepID=A0A9D4LER0_DREPO|nr:hypothetical protein DPMN_099017 [Dreissena polymorpha]
MNTKLALGIQRTVQEVRAGPTYSSNIEDQDVEVTTLPPPVPKPGPAGLDTTGKEFVFFDLETRGLERTSHIIQIAAVHSTGQFSTYVMPEKKMSLKASEITGVTVVGDSMLVNGHTVTARAFSVSTISDQKVVDDCPCLLKEEVEERVRSLKAGKSPGVDNFFSELIQH